MSEGVQIAGAYVTFTSDYLEFIKQTEKLMRESRKAHEEVQKHVENTEKTVESLTKSMKELNSEANKAAKSLQKSMEGFSGMFKGGNFSGMGSRAASSLYAGFKNTFSAAIKGGASFITSSFSGVMKTGADLAIKGASALFKGGLGAINLYVDGLIQIPKALYNIGVGFFKVRESALKWADDLTKKLVFLQLDIKYIMEQARMFALVFDTAIIGSVASLATFEEAFVRVRKVVDMSEEGLRTLSESIRSMSRDIAVSAEELAKLTAVGGQLGIRGTDNLAQFTEVLSKLAITTDIIGQEGAAQFARFLNIMQEPESNMQQMASTIVDLGNKFAAFENEILELSFRLSGASSALGITTKDVLGLAAALSAAGVRAELGGSAFSRMMMEMANAAANQSQEIEEFAKVAGVSIERFSDMVRTHPVRAIKMFIEGLDEAVESGENVFAMLEKVNLSQIRTRDVVLRLVSAGELLEDTVQVANAAWEENIALNEEARKRHESLWAQIILLKNDFLELTRILGEVYDPIAKQVVATARTMLDLFINMSSEQVYVIARFIALAGAIFTTLTAVLMFTRGLLTFLTGLSLLIRLAVFIAPFILILFGLKSVLDALGISLDAFSTAAGGGTLTVIRDLKGVFEELLESFRQSDVFQETIDNIMQFKKDAKAVIDSEFPISVKIIRVAALGIDLVTGFVDSIRKAIRESINVMRAQDSEIPIELTPEQDELAKAMIDLVSSATSLLGSLFSLAFKDIPEWIITAVKASDFGESGRVLASAVWGDFETQSLPKISSFLNRAAVTIDDFANNLKFGEAEEGWLENYLVGKGISEESKEFIKAFWALGSSFVNVMVQSVKKFAKLLANAVDWDQAFKKAIDEVDWKARAKSVSDSLGLTPIIDGIWKWNVEFSEGISDEVKTGLKTGDWSGLFVDVATVWLSFKLVEGAVKGIGIAAVPMLASALKTGSGGLITAATGAIAAITLGIKLMDIVDSETKHDKDSLAKLIINAVGGAALGLVAGPKGALLGATIAMQFDLADKIVSEGLVNRLRGLRKELDVFHDGVVERMEAAGQEINRENFVESFMKGMEAGQISDDLSVITRFAMTFVKLIYEAIRVAWVGFKVIVNSIWTELLRFTADLLDIGAYVAGRIWAGIRKEWKRIFSLDFLTEWLDRDEADKDEFFRRQAAGEVHPEIMYTPDRSKWVKELPPEPDPNEPFLEDGQLLAVEIPKNMFGQILEAFVDLFKRIEVGIFGPGDPQNLNIEDLYKHAHETVSKAQVREIVDLIKHYAGETGLDPYVISAMAVQESNFRDIGNAYSTAVGPLQITQTALKDLEDHGIELENSTETLAGRIEAAVKYLALLRDAYNLAGAELIAAYYAGPTHVLEHGITTDPLKINNFVQPSPYDYLESIRKYFLRLNEGAILPGYGGGDRIPALLEAGEAVVPANVVRGGLGDIVSWFKSNNVRRLSTGYNPGLSMLSYGGMHDVHRMSQDTIDQMENMTRQIEDFRDKTIDKMVEITNTLSGAILTSAQFIADVLKYFLPDELDGVVDSYTQKLESILNTILNWGKGTGQGPIPEMGVTSYDGWSQYEDFLMKRAKEGANWQELFEPWDRLGFELRKVPEETLDDLKDVWENAKILAGDAFNWMKSSWSDKVNGMRNVFAKAVLYVMGVDYQKTRDNLLKMGKGFNDVAEVMGVFNREAADAVRQMQRVVDILASLPGMLKQLQSGFTNIRESLSDLLGGDGTGDLLGQMAAGYVGWNTFSQTPGGGTNWIAGIGGAMMGLGIGGPVGAILALGGLLIGGMMPQNPQDPSAKGLQQYIEDLNEELREWGATYQSPNVWFENQANWFQRLFGGEDWVTHGEDAAEAGREIAERLISSMQQTFQVLSGGIGNILFNDLDFDGFAQQVGARLQQVFLDSILQLEAIKGPLQELSVMMAEAMQDGLTSAEIENIKELARAIFDSMEPFSEIADAIAEAFGLAEESARGIGRALHNVPTGFKINLRSWQAAHPRDVIGVSAMEALPHSGGARDVKVINEINVEIQQVDGVDDLERQLTEIIDRLLAKSNTTLVGLVTGGRY